MAFNNSSVGMNVTGYSIHKWTQAKPHVECGMDVSTSLDVSCTFDFVLHEWTIYLVIFKWFANKLKLDSPSFFSLRCYTIIEIEFHFVKYKWIF